MVCMLLSFLGSLKFILESHNDTSRQPLKGCAVMRAIDTFAYGDKHLTMTLTAADRLVLNESSERVSGRSSDASGSAVKVHTTS